MLCYYDLLAGTCLGLPPAPTVDRSVFVALEMHRLVQCPPLVRPNHPPACDSLNRVPVTRIAVRQYTRLYRPKAAREWSGSNAFRRREGLFGRGHIAGGLVSGVLGRAPD